MPRKILFLQRKPESGSFGQRRSHQDYQGVLNTVCTQRRCLETNVYIIYTFYQPAFVELQNVKGWKLFKITNGKTETNWMRNLQFFVANHLWISFSFFVISNILQPCLFGPRPTNGNSLMKFLADLMSALFPEDHHQRFPQLGSKGRIRERIVFDSQHQIVFQLNFYFCTVRPGIDLQKSENRIFLLTLKTSACPWKSGILSPKLGKNPTILVKNIQNWANLPPGRGPQIRNDISPPAFRFCSVSNFKSRKVDFLPKISGVFPVFSSLLTDI